MTDQVLFEFLTPLAVREGATVVEPLPGAETAGDQMRFIMDRLRHVPARISSPDPARRYHFAERGAQGRWLLIWVPD